MTCRMSWRGPGALTIFLAMGPCLAVPQSFGATPPYPASRTITGIAWDFSTTASLRKAQGSDLWPLAWAADGNLYGAWGDGGGFDGDSNNIGRVSLGFARIAGAPSGGDPAGIAGRNVWGDAPAYAENRATFGGKVDDLISIDGVLYGQGGLWTASNCNCADPTTKPGSNGAERTLTWSADLGKSWHIAPWTTPTNLGATLQFGQNYAGAWDPAHVYFYFQRDTFTDSAHLYLRRASRSALREDPRTRGHFEYLSRIDQNGAPTWSANAADAAPVFDDPAVPAGTFASASIVYGSALGRYLLVTFHGASTGQIGLFESAAPWGPWATVAYYDDWGGLNEMAGAGNGLTLPAKWMSEDGRTLWAVFSAVTNGFDSFNVVKAVLTTRSGIPQIQSPAGGTELTPNEHVSVHGAGNALVWHVDLLGDGAPAFASGVGPTFTFTVPGDARPGTIIRVTLQSTDGRVYRDYPVSANAGATVPNVTIDFVSSGQHLKLTRARTGALGYIDRQYVLTEVSSTLDGNWLIQTANDDKTVTAPRYLQLRLDGPGTVYVCYSGTAARRPEWIDDGSWAYTPQQCTLSDLPGVPRLVYRKSVPGGLVTLGGNREPPSSGPDGYSNFVVVVGP